MNSFNDSEEDKGMALGAYPGLSISRASDREMALIYFYWSGEERRRTLLDSRSKQRVEQLIRDCFEEPLLPYRVEWAHGDLILLFCSPDPSGPLPFKRSLMTAALEFKGKLEKTMRPHRGAAANARLHAGCSFGLLKRGRDPQLKVHEMTREALQNSHNADALDEALRLSELERLLGEKALRCVYQPIVNIREGRPLGYEALSRPQGSAVFPGPLPLFEFAERAGMDYPLDQLAREQAISGSAGLRPGEKLFLNLTPQIINDPQFTPWRTLDLLRKHRLTPEQVVFEITERSSIEDFGSVERVLAHYRSQGYRIAIDDVGAGYSSLLSVVELKPDYIKVDRAIVSGLHTDSYKAHILETLVLTADRMGIDLIAEGVETQDELDKLLAMGVNYAQGYLLGRPGEIGWRL
ncbi:EAL domain-containing protein [Cohnella fermenti]|uniref:EAL domain-containing protein n=1 Tax=Cohnella fermenti TaxID=2565925 RepID=A0A4S4C1V6_9BACL|nr:EAL domain-containing protein [Cohnella fermenti]THF81641.1 EAL domain-containing protein [Cohnella fermenti]